MVQIILPSGIEGKYIVVHQLANIINLGNPPSPNVVNDELYYSKVDITVDELSVGIYFYRIASEGRMLASGSMVIQR